MQIRSSVLTTSGALLLEQLQDAIAELGGTSGVGIQRYKGLGEMDAEQLWSTTMNPEQRVMKQVTLADALIADGVFSTLMGDEVAPRREFIVSYARDVKNLDI